MKLATLNEIFGLGKEKPVFLTVAAQDELVRLFDSLSGAAEDAQKAVATQDKEGFSRAYETIRRTNLFIENVLTGRGPKEFR